MTTKMWRVLGAMVIGALLALSSGQAAVAAHRDPTVMPREGVPGVVFAFTMAGFRGAVPAEDANYGQGEEIAYWANTPDGGVISTEARTGVNDRGNDTKPLLARANGYGEASIHWTAPENVIPGYYTMVFRGKQSGYEIVIPFVIHPDGWQTEVQTNVAPSAGPAGSEFLFLASGYEGAPTDRKRDDSHGERVSYWFNTPSGEVIGTELRNEKSDYGNNTKPLLHFADGLGTVSIFWTAPADLAPGAYSIVIHGLSSHREVLINFTIR
jgi:hypothetical protein